MRVAVIGALGQLGTDLCHKLGDEAVPLTHDDVELTEPDSIRRALDRAAPEYVVNTAAYNLVDRAEDEPERAYAVNALGARNLATVCADRDVPLVHVSTDHVFGLDRDRTKPYRESDAPGPVSVYGVSKLAGEYFVRSLCKRHFVVRTCGLYGKAGLSGRGKGNFVETMLRLGRERPEVRVVDDQRCTPTATVDLAHAIVRLMQTDAYGLYHVTNAGDVTWFEFATEIFRLAGFETRVVPVRSDEFGAKARRPAYSVLDCEKLRAVTGFKLRSWRDALSEYLSRRSTEEI
ncbi:MAG: dTDP-4-dehydrorhamnose reductase [Planctomycetes bacterium]|nr:dTDP-4-dehydrorhamnose reductase [Planctomycetota bacterium]